MTVRLSLFESSGGSPLANAGDWLTGTLLGSVAVSLCVLAVASVGLMLLSGRIAIREAVRVALGCFVLLGAPLIAAGLRGVADEAANDATPSWVVIEAPPSPPPLPPADYGPYAGASLRRD